MLLRLVSQIGCISIAVFLYINITYLQYISQLGLFPFRNNIIVNKSLQLTYVPTLGGVTQGNNTREFNSTSEPMSVVDVTFTPTGVTHESQFDASCVPTPFVICNVSQSSTPTMMNETLGIASLRKIPWIDVKDLFQLSKCEYSNCYFQNDHVNESISIVVVEIVGMPSSFKPVQRWPHQLYVALAWESPENILALFFNDRNSYWNKSFNLTATYRTDSDLFVPYSQLIYKPLPRNERPNYYEIARKKTKWIVWLVSNCKTKSKRDQYIKQMQKFIDVDIYGVCGDNCTDPCTLDTFTQYRYYLSFENSLCDDYVTEKFFKLFAPNSHILPVVRSAFNYTKYLPKNTYIDAAYFVNSTKLALYLRRLGEDPLTYSRFLQQKDMYRKSERYIDDSIGCKACEYKNTHHTEKQISDLRQWMVDDKCYKPLDL